jgi:hypothetical protein
MVLLFTATKARLGIPHLLVNKGVRNHPYGTTNSTGSLNYLTNTVCPCLVPDNLNLEPKNKLLKNKEVKLILYVVECLKTFSGPLMDYLTTVVTLQTKSLVV